MDDIRVEAIVEVRFKTFKNNQPGSGMNAGTDEIVIRYGNEAIAHRFKVPEKNIFGDLPVSAQDGVNVQIPLVPRSGGLMIGISPVYFRFIMPHRRFVMLMEPSFPVLRGSSPTARRSTPVAEVTDRGVG